MSNCEKICRNMSDLLDSRANERVRKTMEMHVSQCPACATHYEQLQLQCGWLAQDEAGELPAGLHEAIMHKIESAPCPTRRLLPWARPVAVLCCCAVVALAAFRIFPTFLAGQPAMSKEADLSVAAAQGSEESDTENQMLMQPAAPEERFESSGVTRGATASGQADGSIYMTSSDATPASDQEQQTSLRIEGYLTQVGLVLVVEGNGSVTMDQLLGSISLQTLEENAALISASDAAQLQEQFAQQWPDLTLYRYESELDVETTGVIVLLEP